MAMGGDQGGSIRIPSSICGIVGLKPTFGLVPYTGIAMLDLTVDHTGPMAQTVYDTALLLEVNITYLIISNVQQFCNVLYKQRYLYNLFGQCRFFNGYHCEVLAYRLLEITAFFTFPSQLLV